MRESCCVVQAPAKINLWLDVLRKREDGYHDLQMVNASVGLYDELVLTPRADARIELTVWPPSSGLSAGAHNLVVRAARLLQKRCPTQGVSIRLTKRIPIGAGLAGGSSDAAAALRGLNRLWGLGLSARQLMNCGFSLGADIPFCLDGRPALVEGRGEHVQTFPVSIHTWIVMLQPPFCIPTASVFRRWSAERARGAAMDLIRALQWGEFAAVCRSVDNALTSIVEREIPLLARLRARFQQAGAMAVSMSGSGSTLFGLMETETAAVMVKQQLQREGLSVCAVPLWSQGPRA